MGVFSQTNNDSITINDYGFRKIIFQGKKVTANEALPIMRSNSRAYQEMTFAKLDRDISNWMVFCGLGLVAIPLVKTSNRQNPNWYLASIGGSLLVFSFPFREAFSNHYYNAVRIYNDGLNTNEKDNISLNIGLTTNVL